MSRGIQKIRCLTVVRESSRRKSNPPSVHVPSQVVSADLVHSLVNFLHINSIDVTVSGVKIAISRPTQ